MRIAPVDAVRPSRSDSISRLIVFDLDGTLVDSAGDLASAVNEALFRHGLRRLGDARIVGFIGEGARRLVERSVRVADPDASSDRIDQVLETFSAHYGEHCLDQTGLYPGMLAAIDGLLREGARLGVLTNKPRRPAERILAGLGVRDRFDHLIAGDDLPTRKPDPGGLNLLLARTRCAPDEAVLVGDSVVDVETGRRARVPVVGVGWGPGSEAELRRAGACHIVDRVEDLVGLCALAGRCEPGEG